MTEPQASRVEVLFLDKENRNGREHRRSHSLEFEQRFRIISGNLTKGSSTHSHVGTPVQQPSTLVTYGIRRGFAAKLALWAVVGAGFGGLATSALGASTVYNRTAAVNYANANWNKVVADGYFWINGSTANKYGAGAPVPVNVPNEAGGIGDDCAHFVSSCIGSPAGATTGGLIIPSRAGTYGEPGAARLDELLVGNSAGGYGTTYKYGQLVSSVSQLTPGDVIGYDWDGSGNGSMGGIDHTVIYVGNNQVDCHAASHLGANWSLGGADNYFFIHITLPDSIVPTAPHNTSPAPNASVADLVTKLIADTFSDGAIGSTHIASDWEIFKGSSLIYDSGTDTTNLQSLTVPANVLSAGNTYSWRVRYEDNYGDWSSYSASTSFSTLPVPEPAGALITCGALLLSTIRRR
jgi:hypothetical protein